jgi:hypothetical protein
MAEQVYKIILTKDEVQPVTIPMFSNFLCAQNRDGTVYLFYRGDEGNDPETHVIEQVVDCGELKDSFYRFYLGSAIGSGSFHNTAIHIFELHS